MALADLTHKIQAYFTQECGKITFTDITGLYNGSTNVGGWNDVSTFDNSNITSALIRYRHSSETDWNEINVTTTLSTGNIEGDFLLDTVDIETGDGQYFIEYELGDGVDTIIYETCIYNLCSVRCCVDKLWVEAAKSLDNDCSCSSTESNNAKKGESFIQGILKSSASGFYDLSDSLLEKLQRLCNNQNCNCN